MYSRDFTVEAGAATISAISSNFEALIDLENDRFALVGGEFAQGARNGQGEFHGEDGIAAHGGSPSRVSGWSSSVSPSGRRLRKSE